MEDRPTTIRIYPGELRPVYYTSVLASQSTPTLEVIRLALERLQIFEDKTLYELYEGCPGNESNWVLVKEGDFPVVRQTNWQVKDTRFHLKRKQNASLVLQQLVSDLILPGGNGVNENICDLCALEELSEETMLSCLKARFYDKSIYTCAGTILIAVNPYYFYSIYNPKYTALYQRKSLEELPPHIFAIADRSYHAMLGDRQNQTVIISGESGAGKTESTKFLLHHLMSLSAKMDETQSLELITLGTGPVLEAFGNARTLANNNSSRFGKFIQVQFKENGAYYCASIEKYLLEKSRIISQAPGERNYHVFYYLLAGADTELRRTLKLLQLNQYHYLTQGAALAPVEGVEEYHRLRQSLTMLSFSEQTQLSMFTVLSAILHIGNVKFLKKDGEDAVVIQNMDTLAVISKLLRVREETLRLALTTRKSRAGGADLFITPYKMDEAVAARDSLAKALYGSLFDWIVDQVNISLASSSSRAPHKGHFIGVLDIFGFEVFQNNSFEQFCINYANEQLQQYFNKHIFKLEQAEYSSEGIEWSAVSFIDNQECLDLIAKKPTGLLPLLDEECSFPGADDNSLFQKFERQHKLHPHYHTPQLRHQNPVFTVVHYASEVTYSVKGFRTKNRDLMRQDIIDVLRTSHMDMVRALIGLPPYAVHRWHMAYHKVVSTFAFKRAGAVYKLKREGRIAPSFQQRLRAATPPIHFNQHDGPGPKFHQSQSYALTGNLTDALGAQTDSGQLTTSASVPGIRASRSYSTLSEMTGQGWKRGEMARSSSKEEGPYLTYGLSPRAMRRPKDLSPEDAPDTQFYVASTPDSPLPRQSSLDHSPHSPSPLFTLNEPSSPVTLTKVVTPVPGKGQTGFSLPQQQGHVQSPTQAHPSVPSSLTTSHQRKMGTATQTPRGKITTRRVSREKRLISRMDSRNRLPSISHLQEKLRKRWPRTLRIMGSSGGSVGGGELNREKASKYWKTAPRLRDTDSVDANLLNTLARAASKRHHGPSKTVSGQFQSSLIALMETLEKTNPHFVRCLKSNNRKAPCMFDEELVLRQLRYTGMVQTVKIRKAGYSVRINFEDFYEKYQFLMGVRSPDLASQIDLFLKGMDFTLEHFQVGTTKVFMKEAQKYALEEELREKVLARIVVIQRWVRAKLLRCRFLHIRRSAITLQSAVRGWLCRVSVDEMRLRVCKAVEIQTAWRGFQARKRFIRLKQAAIILQAHWRGLTDRRRHIVLLEEKRKEWREQQMRHEQELRNQQLLADMEAAEAREAAKGAVKAAQLRGHCRGGSDGVFLDSEVSDVLFHFDTIVTELEKSTLTPRSLTPNEPTAMRTPTPNQMLSRKLSAPDATESVIKEGPRKSVQPKFKIEDIKQQFLQNAQRDLATQLNMQRSVETPSSRDKVRSIIAQMQASSRENSPSPAPSDPEVRAPSPVKQGRPRASSISQRISMLTQVSTEPEVFEKKEQPVVLPSRKISELTQGFELKSKPPESRSRPKSASSHRRRRSSSTRKADDSPKILSPPKSSSRRVAQVNGLPSAETPGAGKSLVMKKYSSREIEEALGELVPSVSKTEEPPKTETLKTETQSETGITTGHIEKSISSEVIVPPGVLSPPPSAEPQEASELDQEEPSSTNIKELDDAMSFSTSSEGLAQSSEPTSEAITSRVCQSTTSGDEAKLRTESTSSCEVLLTPPVEAPYRFRSISDVSHNTRMLTSYHTESSISSSSIRGDTKDQSTDVPLSKQYSKKKRKVVSVADPTDILTNLQLAHIHTEDSSELTHGLRLEDVRRLNQKQERLRVPADRLKLFSFSKRHLRLPFSRGKTKKEKHVKLASSPEKMSPKRKGLKGEARNKRLSRAQADQLLSHNFTLTSVVKGLVCGVCHKGFTGFMKQSQRCADCGVVVHKHCEYRSPPCKAQIESGSYVTMSRKKIVKALEDLDDLAQFLMDKISQLNKDGSANSKVDQVFEQSLLELHNSLLSNYSLTLQKSLDVSGHEKESSTESSSATQSTEMEQRVTITFSQLVNNFTNTFKGVAKRRGLSDPGYLAISVNQMKTFLDEFSKRKRRSMVKVMSGGIEPATLRRKTFSGHGLELVDHNGHKFFTELFKVATVCEYCNDPIPILEKGEVCIVCGYTCHQSCLKLTTGRCVGKDRTKSPPPTSKPEATQSMNQFGVELESLVPPGSTQVPVVLEKCFQYIEDHGLFIQGIYRKSPGASSKRAVKATLEEDPVGCSLEGFHVNAVAAAVGAFFRELPTPLLPKDRYTDLLRTVDLTDREERLEALHHLLGRLPALNHAVFERLIFHLARVAQQEPTNKMSPYNLAVIFAPCIFQGETKSKNPQDLLKELAKQTLVLELIIEEQVEKLQATLRGIETLSVVARHTASKLTELIASDESVSRSQPVDASSGTVSAGEVPPRVSVTEGMKEEDERERLTSELQEIERERVELTVNLPKLEPFTRDHHASWVIDSRDNSPTPYDDDTSLPTLSSHTPLPALTKNRVSQKPKSRRPTRRTAVKGEPDESTVEESHS